MMLLAVVVLGFCMGSFINALVWRTYKLEALGSEPGLNKAQNSKLKTRYSILHGRSMCSACGHRLSVKDLIPVLSWISLKGRCRYCQKPIQDSPLTELAAATAFAVSYLWWPKALQGAEFVHFGLWLIFLTGLLALLIYDKRWSILPDRITYPLIGLAVVQVGIRLLLADGWQPVILEALWGAAIGGGIFYLIFQFSGGRWIGGGDVKLGMLLGLIVGGPPKSFMMLFLAAVMGSMVALPLLITKKVSRNSQIPFGPFLIVAAIIVQLAGTAVWEWYRRIFLPFEL